MEKYNLNTNLREQMLHELETWLRTLNYIQQENIYLKNRLAEIIKNGMDDAMLEQVEYFQSQFLNKDTVITLLRQDIAIERNLNGDLSNIKNQKTHDKLRKDMGLMEAEFSKLKFEFNNYLSHSL